MTIETSISYQVVQNSKYYLHLLYHRLVPEKRFEGHCHRSKLHFWQWQNGYIPDTGKVSGFWMSFVTETHFYRQKTKYTKPAAKLVPTTSGELIWLSLWIMLQYIRADPPEMPLRNWYNCGTNHFNKASVVWWKWKTQPDRAIKSSNTWSCVKDQILEHKNLRNMIINVCTGW